MPVQGAGAASAYKDPFTGSNLGDALFGLGVFLCPLLIAFLHNRVGFSKALTFVALLGVIPFALAIGQDLGGGELDGDLAAAFAGFSELFSDRTIWLLGFTMMCWVVIESGTAGWATTLVKESAPEGEPEETSDKIAAQALSAFWLCFMGARLLTAWLIHGAELESAELVRITQFVQVGIAILAVLTMLSLAAAKSRRFVVAAVIFAGLICGPFFPNVIGQLFTHLKAHDQMAFAGRSVGMIFACASVGWTLLPIAMGYVALKKNIRTSFLLPAAAGVVMTVLILVNRISV